MEEKKKGAAPGILLASVIILFALLICAIALFLFTYSELSNARRLYVPSSSENAGDGSSSYIQAENVRLNKQLLAAEQSRVLLESRIASLESELTELKEVSGADDTALAGMIADLKDELDRKKSEIEALKRDLRLNALGGPVDLNGIGDAVSRVSSAVSDIPANLVIKTNVLRLDEGIPVVDENGEAVYDVVESTPRVALCYADLTRGYRCSFGSEDLFSSPEMNMLLLSYQLVTSKIAEDNRISRAEEPGEEEEHTEQTAPEYDFDEMLECVLSSEEAEKSQDNRYTVAELISIMLKYGDKAAYNALSKRFGEARTQYAAGTAGFEISGSTISFSCKQAEKFAESVYDLIESENRFAEDMNKALRESVHSALSGYAVSPKEVAHLCLRDGCYGDVAFVYDEHPYVIVILSDMMPGDAQNKYLSSLIELTDDLHEALGR